MLPPGLGVWAPRSAEVDPATHARILIESGAHRDSQLMFKINRTQRLRKMFQAFCIKRGLPFATTRFFAKIDGRELHLDDTVEGTELGWLAEIVAMPPAGRPLVAWSKSKALSKATPTASPPGSDAAPAGGGDGVSHSGSSTAGSAGGEGTAGDGSSPSKKAKK